MKVQFYVMGVYRGEREIGDDSICGRLLSDIGGAMSRMAQMGTEIETVQRCHADTATAIANGRRAHSANPPIPVETVR